MEPADKVLVDKIEHRFKAHQVDEEGQKKMGEIRDACKAAAQVIAFRTPICADQTAALRHLEEAMFTANAAIARGGR